MSTGKNYEHCRYKRAKSRNSPEWARRFSIGRSIIKIDASFPQPRSNEYGPYRFSEIDRIVLCQTKETNFANKLIALTGRYKKHGSIAGRDIYDIHHYLVMGFAYNVEVVKE